MEGQLWPAERSFLHMAIRRYRPTVCLEVGTWKGGGSTWQIVTALEANRRGRLWTCEPDHEHFAAAKAVYTDRKSNRFGRLVELHNCTGAALIAKLKANNKIPDFVIFDGPEDPQINFDDFQSLHGWVKPGCVFICHDWDLGMRSDGQSSVKAKLLRPHLESHQGWRIEGQLTAPESVGMVMAIKT